MPATKEKEKETKEKKPAEPKINPDMVSKCVSERLGKPKDLRKVDCILLWDNHFRVNVWCGDPQTIRHSYFITANTEGIINTHPEIKKEY